MKIYVLVKVLAQQRGDHRPPVMPTRLLIQHPETNKVRILDKIQAQEPVHNRKVLTLVQFQHLDRLVLQILRHSRHKVHKTHQRQLGRPVPRQ